jgi:uncharacterized membrane protein
MSSLTVLKFLSSRSGAVSIISALSLMTLLAVAAITIDVGSLYFARRNLQAANDAAALAAVQNPANATAIAEAIFSRNGYSGETLTVSTGTYIADETLDAGDRFTADPAAANAVRVRVSIPRNTHFAWVFGLGNLATVTTQAIAARIPTASFAAGTRLAELDDGVANSLLGAAWRSNLSLSLFDYQAMASTNVALLPLLNQVATNIGVTSGYQQLAEANVTIGQIVEALIETANTPGASSGNTAGALLALQSLQLQLQPGQPVRLSDLIDFSFLYGRSIGGVVQTGEDGEQVNVMGLLSSSARSGLTGQTTDIGSALNIPGINASVTTRIASGTQMAQLANAEVGSSIQTGQVRVALTVTLTDINLGIATATVQIPLYLELAPGQATLNTMPCATGGTRAEVLASSGALSVQFGTVSDAVLRDFSNPVTPASAPIISTSLLGVPIQVNLSGTMQAATSGDQLLSFTQDDIDNGTVKSATNGSTAPFTALGQNMTVSTVILGDPGLLGSLLDSQLTTLTSALQPVLADLLSRLNSPTNDLLTTLGLQLGITDVRMFDASCRVPTLVG